MSFASHSAPSGAGPSQPASGMPDSLRPDTLRPDSLCPDTLRPDTLRPDTEQQARDLITWAAQNGGTVDLCGQGTKRGYGRPVEADHRLDLSGLTGIVSYAPAELVITVKTGTPVRDVRAALTEAGQHFAFEPLVIAPLYAAAAWQTTPMAPETEAPEGTIGGMVASNLAGARRLVAGGVRDHLLGVRGINGHGIAFKAGGTVVKNVTGFDLCKLMAGSWGTLAAMTKVSLKVLPAPPETRTLLVHGLSPAAAVETMAQMLGSPVDLSGAVHLSAPLLAAAGKDTAAPSVTAFRIDGHGPSVAARSQALRARLQAVGDVEETEGTPATLWWDDLRQMKAQAAVRPHIVWRLSVPPSHAPALITRLERDFPGVCLLDWGGGLIWWAIPAVGGAAKGWPDGGVAVVRAAMRDLGGGGHATLVLAPREIRAAVEVFPPQAAALAGLTERIRQTFDPCGVFSPGRMRPVRRQRRGG